MEEDAERIMKVLPKRFGRYDLALPPEKTRVVDFRRPGPKAGKGKVSFDFFKIPPILGEIPHVRICGTGGRATSLGHPTIV